ncbi:PaaX family transcriptional regulator C-terminal domain-containing protein [Jannaschia formosa]|uniref:PaaX family transcriptional regulator C-terminal domain-containing protein n=1 Tax=Jannaschia formosa TaxID=2259592 RepID=UPI000E1BED93|nr:PaaX family transcriptional regulator C-terminal domain-containing protein [Jannaschia formosa]TFL17701.1 hypothetical protein DR046_13665 [Jannaschia formosa]
MSDPHPLVLHLTEGVPPRTWSVLVTIFGDLARAPGDEIGSPVLARMGEAMGLRPEAMRTALHRLHKEGWLERRREGRHSLYGLSPRGLAESEAAGPRIYGPERATHAFVLLGPATGPGYPVAPAISVAGAPSPEGETLSFPLEAPPGWMRDALLPPETAALIRVTRRRFDALTAALAGTPPQDALLVAVLRVLCVHAWRRIALRLPDLPDRVLPAGEDLAAARATFARLRSTLPAPPLAEFEP